MMNWEEEKKIIQLILGELPPAEAEAWQETIQKDPVLQKEYQQYQDMYSAYQQVPLEKNNSKAVEKFDAWLGTVADQQGKKPARQVGIGYWKYGIAASFFLLVGWFFLAKPTQNQVNNASAQENLLQMISAQSTTERIKGVRQMSVKEPDPKIVQALLKLLQTDESANVRLTIVEALQVYTLNNQIKDGLIAALETEKQPIVQIAIINTLVELGEDKIKPSLESLIDNEEVQPFVQDEARLGLTRL